MILIQ